MDAEQFGPKGDRLRAAIMRLPKYERLVITLFYFEDLNDVAIARVLERDVAEITELRARGIRRIRQAME